MLELLIFPVAAGGAILWKLKRNSGGNIEDKKVIREVFENIGVGIVKGHGKDRYVEYPRLIKAYTDNEEKPYDTYIYKIPLGIPFSTFAKMKEPLQDGLGRDLNLEFGDKIVKMKIAKKPLASLIPLQPFLDKTKKWEVLIGLNPFEIATHDFDKYPIIVGGGATRFGKTVLMKNILAQLIRQNPEDIHIWVIDLKGGVEFWEYEKLKQVNEVTSKGIEAYHLLKKLNQKLDSRMEYFRNEGYKNIVDTPIKQRDFIIIDESHDLFKSTDKAISGTKAKDIEYFVGRLASMGGAFGFRMMAFTQYPVKEAMPQFIKQNAPVRIAFQTADATASRVILDQGGAEDLPGIPGRCVIKSFKYTTVQVPAYIDEKGNVKDNYELVKQYEVSKDEQQRTESDQNGEDIVDFGLPGIREQESTTANT